MAWIFAAFGLLMLVIFLGLLVTLSFANPGLYSCGFFGLLFAFVGYAPVKARTFAFQWDADYLENAVSTCYRWAARAATHSLAG